MNTRTVLIPLLFAVAASLSAEEPCCCAAKVATTSAAPAALPDTSLYQLGARWQNQDGADVALADLAGAPVIITMVFSHCAYACPRIVADLKAIRAALPAATRDHVRFVLASFDSTRDTPARLHEWAAEQNLGAGWTLLHGDENAVRELSVLLDIPYVPQPDGSFAHGNRIVLLDRHGVAVTAIEGLGAPSAPLVEAVAALMQAP